MRRTKIRTKLLYVQTGVPLWIVQVPLLALFKLRIRLSPPPNRKGLGILDFASEPRDGAFFGDLVAAGLEIAERLDPKRFERIQKHIRFVISMKRITIANYWRLGRCCSIDLNRCIFRRGSEYLIKEIACILIHESTHGVIEELRIPYTAQNKFRIERLCTMEAMRFAKRFNDAGFDWEDFFRERIEYRRLKLT